MKRSGKLTAKEIFIVAALILFLIPGLCATYSGVHRAVEKFSDPEKKYQEVVFVKEYPFPDGNRGIDLTAAEESTLLRKYLAVADKLTNYIDIYSGKRNIVSPFFLNVYGKTTAALGKNLIEDAENPVIRLKNGYLTSTNLYSKEYDEYAGFVEFKEWLSKRCIPFLMVLPADKSDAGYAVLPKGVPDGDAEKGIEYVEHLDDNGISYLNSGEMLVSENEDFYLWFYKTDHHWNVHAGFSVAEAIAQKLKTEFGLQVDVNILDRSNFNNVTYENIFLGSQGKKATHGYVSPEDFEVFYPDFDTAFSIEIPTKMIDRTDTFENTLINSEALKPGSVYTKNAYDAFLHGNVPLARIHNLNCNNGTRALMIKTSDANVVNAYLAFTVEYLDIVDPRHFDGSIRMLIEKTRPDVVLTCAFPSEALDNKMLDIK